MQSNLLFIGNDSETFVNESFGFLSKLENDFHVIEKNILEIIESKSKIQFQFFDFDKITQNVEFVRDANIIIFFLNYSDSKPLDIQNEWLSVIKNCLSDNQHRFLIGNTSNDFDTNNISDKIINSIHELNIEKFFEKRSGNFLTEKYQIGQLTVFPNFHQFLANQITQIEFTENTINYILYPITNTAQVTQSPEAKGSIIIKASVNYNSKNYKITEIGDYAFKGTKISSFSFEQGSYVKRIGELSFFDSTISSLSIPDSLEEFDENWCGYVEHLNEIIILNPNHPHFRFENGLLINKDSHEIIFALRNLYNEIIIPEDIKKIGPFAFYTCRQIESFMIKSSAFESIGSYAFFQCENLENFHISEAKKLTFGFKCFAFSKTLENVCIKDCDELIIGNNCFENCTSLELLCLPINKLSFGSMSMAGCVKCSVISISGNNSVTVNDNCFYHMEGLNLIEIKTDQLTISDHAFVNCPLVDNVILNANNNIHSKFLRDFNKLTSICLISNSKLTITKSSFENASYLKTIELKSKNLFLENGCFKNLSKLSSIQIECENSTNFLSGSFKGCKALKYFKYIKSDDMDLSEQINIADNCFEKSEKLEEVEIKAKSINLGNSCFFGSKKLQKIHFQGQFITISDFCFFGCDSIKLFEIKESRDIGNTENVELGSSCFTYSNKLEKVDIESRRIYIGDNCFAKCEKLQNVLLHSTNIRVSYNCFYESSIESFEVFNYQNIYNTKEVKLDEKCFNKATKLGQIEIKADTISIGYNCFYNAESLKEVDFDGRFVTVSDYCFNECKELESFIVRATRTAKFDKSQFTNCPNLKKINISVLANRFDLLEPLVFGEQCFQGADGLQEIEFVGGPVHISNELFGLSSLSKLSIKSAKEVIIDANSFNKCNELSSIYINSQSLKIDKNCFNNNMNLKELIFDCNDIYINEDCFNELKQCKKIEFKNASFMYFKSRNFCHLNNLTNLELNSIYYIISEMKCFRHLEKLEKLKFQSKMVSFGEESFVDCPSLQSVIAFNEVKSFLSKPFSAGFKTSSDTYKIEKISISSESFLLCNKLNELNIEAEKEIIISNDSFSDLTNLKKIKINCPSVYIDESCFSNCPVVGSISQNCFRSSSFPISLDGFEFHRRADEGMRFKEDPPKLILKSKKKFNSFYVLGIDINTKRPSFISMFPSTSMIFENDDIQNILSFCYPGGIIPITPSNEQKESNILNGFVFYFGNDSSGYNYIGVVLQIFIPSSINSFVGEQYDRNYPFCLCIITDDPDISSHFSFLQSLVHPIVGKKQLPFQSYQIPSDLNQFGNFIDNLYIKPTCDYIAISASAYSMSFLLPKLVNYYNAEKSNLLIRSQSDYLLYPTFSTLLSYFMPSQIIDILLCLLCEFKVLIISENINKASFSVIALTNLLKKLDLYSLVIPCLPKSSSFDADSSMSCIIGSNNVTINDAIIFNLDNGKITCENNELSLIQNYPNIAKLKEKVEKLFKLNYSKFTVLNDIKDPNELKELIKNAHKNIYPECFQSFVQIKCIFNLEFINDFSTLISNLFISSLKNFSLNCIVTGFSGLGNHIIDTFLDTKTFIYFQQIIEKEIEKSKNTNRNVPILDQQKTFNQENARMQLVLQKSKKQVRSSSCPCKRKSMTFSSFFKK